MVDLSRVRNYYVACGYTDLRRGIDGLAAMVMTQYGMELREDSLFLFCGRRTDRIKALYWSGDGYVLIYKRLSNGSFQWPRSTEELKNLDAQSFRWLMEGLKIEQPKAIRKGATPVTSKAAVGYEYCSKLFALERKFETFAPKTRQQARQAQVESLLDVYWAWVEKLDPAPGSKLEDAVAYAKNQKAFLNEFMCHGEVDISNNIAENAIRPFVVGRKNWLFCDTPKGAEASAVVYTLVETAKANGLDPFRYLNYVLLNIRFLGQNPSNEDLKEFLPWNEDVRAKCKPN